jgi:hypothetical protein
MVSQKKTYDQQIKPSPQPAGHAKHGMGPTTFSMPSAYQLVPSFCLFSAAFHPCCRLRQQSCFEELR